MVADEVEKEGLEAWYNLPVERLNPHCPFCKNSDPSEWKKESNVLDVWFDSGSSNQAVRSLLIPFSDFLKVLKKSNLAFPCDVYFEGTDQHRGWFQSSLFCSLVSSGVPPTKNFLTHGFLVDQDGRKFSKSLGNGITPDQVLKEYHNTDVLRLWAGQADWRKDIKVFEIFFRFDS